jgi:hypothetical protein
VARHACSDAGGEGAPPPRDGKHGEKAADGKPKPDKRTVADLVLRGWFDSEQEVVALLTEHRRQAERYSYAEKTADDLPKLDKSLLKELVRCGWFQNEQEAEDVLTKHKRQTALYSHLTAGPAADWLAARLAAVPAEDGVCAATRVIRGWPSVLTLTEETLQRRWDTLLRPQADGGLGYTPERAALLVVAQPQLLAFSRERLLDTAAALEACGVADGTKAIAQEPGLPGSTASTLHEHAAWWRQKGLDYKKVRTAQPSLLKSSDQQLLDKLDFLRAVKSLGKILGSEKDAPFGRSPDGGLRPRFFYSLRCGNVFFTANALGRSSSQPASASSGGLRRRFFYSLRSGNVFSTANALGRSSSQPASAADLASYKAAVESPEFIAWREREEALRRRTQAPDFESSDDEDDDDSKK